MSSLERVLDPLIELLRHKKEEMSRISIPRWIYRFRTYLACPPLLFSLFSSYGDIDADRFKWPLGVAMFGVGMALRIWAQQHLHHRLRVHKQLSSTGPYALVRNPLYVGNIIMCVGVTVLSGLLWFVPVTLFWCIGTYSIVVRYEEARLLSKYGEAYRRYLLEVPRWLPKNWCLRNAGFMNEYFYESFLVELPCSLVLLPYVIKEIVV